MRTVCVLPSQSFASQMPALPKGEPRSRCEFFCLTHKPNLSLPLGEMSRSDREGWNQLAWLFKLSLTRTCLRAALSVICFANASSPKERAEKSVRTFCPYAQTKLVSPSGRDVAQRQRGLESAGMAFQICPDTGFFVFRTKQKRVQICTLFFGGRWWIRTTEVVDNRFTVCPLWPLGKPPIFTCRNRGAGGRT